MNSLKQADSDCGKHRDQEQIRRHHEESAGLPNPAQVDDRQQAKSAEAKSQRPGMKRWKRGSQGSDSGGDTDSRIQGVVDQQRRPGEQPRKHSQVLMSHGV